MKWIKVISEIQNDIIRFKQETLPKESGIYVCTCVTHFHDINYRYPMVMEYDASSKCFHDVNNKYHISHNVLAWLDDFELCDIDGVEYYTGGHFLKTSNKEI